MGLGRYDEGVLPGLFMVLDIDNSSRMRIMDLSSRMADVRVTSSSLVSRLDTRMLDGRGDDLRFFILTVRVGDIIVVEGFFDIFSDWDIAVVVVL